MFRWFTKKTTSATTDQAVLPATDKPASSEQTSVKPHGFTEGFKQALQATQQSLTGQIRELLDFSDSENTVTESMLDDIEDILIRADIGLETAVSIVGKIRAQKQSFQTSQQVMDILKETFVDILAPYQNANSFPFKAGCMNIYLIVGVNGAGKTSFIGKLSHLFASQSESVVIAAGDTFRAAAEEQLQVWAERSGAIFVGKQSQQANDPAAVMFDALTAAKKNAATVVFLDTAGRLHNKHNLMAELQKIQAVVQKEMPDHALLNVLLVVDATTGQNALQQASIFKSCVPVSGVLLSKLDSSSKGGIVLTIAKEHQLPVQMVGTGEGLTDIRPFDARLFVDSLFQ
jgi:fused signal recognition particle receptor